jgi:hypothetical protein
MMDRDITGTTNRDLSNQYGGTESTINTGVPAESLSPLNTPRGNRELSNY